MKKENLNKEVKNVIILGETWTVNTLRKGEKLDSFIVGAVDNSGYIDFNNKFILINEEEIDGQFITVKKAVFDLSKIVLAHLAVDRNILGVVGGSMCFVVDIETRVNVNRFTDSLKSTIDEEIENIYNQIYN